MIAPSASKDYPKSVVKRMMAMDGRAPYVFHISERIDVDDLPAAQNRIELLGEGPCIDIKIVDSLQARLHVRLSRDPGTGAVAARYRHGEGDRQQYRRRGD